MSTDPVILSCIVPFYNVIEFMDELAWSLFHQRMDWVEFVFVDDCSTDGSGSYLAEVIERYKAINTRIITLESNRGPSAARNVGLEVARGKYIWCLDSDDLVNPAAWKQVKFLLEPCHVDVVILDFLYTTVVRQEKLVWAKDHPNAVQIENTLDFVDEKILVTRKPEQRTMIAGRVLTRDNGVIGSLMRDRMFFAWSVIVRRTLYEGVRFPEGKLIEDISTLPKLFFKADHFFLMDIPVIYYRQREGSLLASDQSVLFTDMCGSMRYIKEYIDAHNIKLSALEKLEIDTFHLQTLVWAAVAFRRTGLTRDREALAILNDSLKYFKLSSDISGKRAVANMKATGRKWDSRFARLLLLHPEVYFVLSALFARLGWGRRFLRLLLR